MPLKMITTAQDLPEVGKTYETLFIDIKRTYRAQVASGHKYNHFEMAKDVAAFANSEGGTILIGISENQNNGLFSKYFPLNDEEAKETRDEFEKAVTQRCSPLPTIDPVIIPRDMGFVVAINVHPHPNRLIGVKIQGNKVDGYGGDAYVYWIRTGTSSRQITPGEKESRIPYLVLPRVSVKFENGNTKIKFPRPPHVGVPSKLLTPNSIKEKYGKITIYPSLIGIFLKGNVKRKKEEKDIIDLYNSCLDKYYAAYEQYYYRSIAYHLSAQNPIVLKFVIINDGGAPAEDIDIKFKFPNGLFELSNEITKLKPLRAPTPPIKINSENINEMRKRYSSYNPNSENLIKLIYQDIRPPKLDPKVPVIRVGDSHITASYKADSLKHCFNRRLPSFRLIFDPNCFLSFTFEYTIYLGNLAEPKHGNLEVVLNDDVDAANLDSRIADETPRHP